MTKVGVNSFQIKALHTFFAPGVRPAQKKAAMRQLKKLQQLPPEDQALLIKLHQEQPDHRAAIETLAQQFGLQITEVKPPTTLPEIPFDALKTETHQTGGVKDSSVQAAAAGEIGTESIMLEVSEDGGKTTRRVDLKEHLDTLEKRTHLIAGQSPSLVLQTQLRDNARKGQKIEALQKQLVEARQQYENIVKRAKDVTGQQKETIDQLSKIAKDQQANIGRLEAEIAKLAVLKSNTPAARRDKINEIAAGREQLRGQQNEVLAQSVDLEQKILAENQFMARVEQSIKDKITSSDNASEAANKQYWKEIKSDPLAHEANQAVKSLEAKIETLGKQVNDLPQDAPERSTYRQLTDELELRKREFDVLSAGALATYNARIKGIADQNEALGKREELIAEKGQLLRTMGSQLQTLQQQAEDLKSAIEKKDDALLKIAYQVKATVRQGEDLIAVLCAALGVKQGEFPPVPDGNG